MEEHGIEAAQHPPQQRQYGASDAGHEQQRVTWKEMGLYDVKTPDSHATRVRAAFSDSLDYRPSFNRCKAGNSIDDFVLVSVRESFRRCFVDLSTCFALRLFYDSHDFITDKPDEVPKSLKDLDTAAAAMRLQCRIHVAWLKTVGYDESDQFDGEN